MFNMSFEHSFFAEGLGAGLIGTLVLVLDTSESMNWPWRIHTLLEALKPFEIM